MSARSERRTITCPGCAGLTFTLLSCQCVTGGDRFLVESDGIDREPYRDCLVCRGVGTVAQGCVRCRQRGWRRPQLVLTVANLDTGQVASRSIEPGGLEPTLGPDGWHLALALVVRELADDVGAGGVTDVRHPDWSLDGASVMLPPWWRPDLPADQRHALEAEAIAGQDHYPWRLFLGRTVASPVVDPDRALGRLCALADLLCLDLVVEARHRSWGGLTWDIRYELPGADVPPTTAGQAADLAAAVAAITATDALAGLTDRGLTAPAYAIRPGPPNRLGPPVVDLDQVERRVLADAAGTGGGQAIWRDDRWWHIRLLPGPTTEVLAERDTGQLVCRQRTELLRGWEPPAPPWRGEPIGHTACPDCDPGSRLRRCHCTLGGRSPDPDCASCRGAGFAASDLPCPTCRDSRRVYSATVVTVTDLRLRVVHQHWRPTAGEPATLVATQPGGKPVYQLADRYRLGRWAPVFQVRPEDLTELDGGHEIGQDLRDGIVTAFGAGANPVAEYVGSASRGQPGARLLVLAAVPDVPPLVHLIRLALGLHLGIDVTVEDHRLDADDPRRLHGQRWQVRIVPPDRPTDRIDPPLAPTLETAIATCLEYLEDALLDAVPADPVQPIGVPQTPVPVVVTDPSALIARLGHHYAGQPIAVRFDRAGCQVHVRERTGVRMLACAGTLAAAVDALGLRFT